MWVFRNHAGTAVLCAENRNAAVELAKALAKGGNIEVVISDGQRVEEVISFRNGVAEITRRPVRPR